MGKLCGACDTRHYDNEDCPNPISDDFLLQENLALKKLNREMYAELKELRKELAEYRAKAKRPPWD